MEGLWRIQVIQCYLHLPDVIVTESAEGETRTLLGDDLGSVRQAIDETGAVVAYNEYDPYGNPIVNRKSEIVNPYGFSGEWYEDDIGLLYLRARWYSPGTGTFLSVDSVEGEPPYQYVGGNVVNLTDASGTLPIHPPASCPDESNCKVEVFGRFVDAGWTKPVFGENLPAGHLFLIQTDEYNISTLFEGGRWGVQTSNGIIPIIYPSASLLTSSQLKDKTNEPRVTGSVVVKTGKDVCKKYKCLRRATSFLQKYSLPYQIPNTDSNGLIYTLLKQCALPTKKPSGNYPGWGFDLVHQIGIAIRQGGYSWWYR